MRDKRARVVLRQVLDLHCLSLVLKSVDNWGRVRDLRGGFRVSRFGRGVEEGGGGLRWRFDLVGMWVQRSSSSSLISWCIVAMVRIYVLEKKKVYP